jgi:uncharacterized delta-60 repeat protein
MRTHLIAQLGLSGHVLVALCLAATTLVSHAQSPPADDLNPGTDGTVYAQAVQKDGKIVIGGLFTTVGGLGRTNLARLNSDGTVDADFHPVATDPGAPVSVSAVVIQEDGKIIVGGTFSILSGQWRKHLARLLPDGTLDPDFATSAGPPSSGDLVATLALQSDGKILYGGIVSGYAGMRRLNPDGTADTNFSMTASGPIVATLALQPDGKILVSGNFTKLDGQSRTYFGRLNPNGSLDESFNPLLNTSYGAFTMCVQPDGKILFGGDFSAVNGYARTNLARLNTDGTCDASFDPGLSPGRVQGLALQADGKILVGGTFYRVSGQSHTNLAKLNPDGSADAGFIAHANSVVYTVAVEPDGRILAGGGFTTLAGQARNGIGRLYNTEPAIENLSLAGSTLTWLRGGSCPELRRVTLDASTNGTDWTSLGAASRISGGWQLSGISVPANATIRASGPVCGDESAGSGWFLQSSFEAFGSAQLSRQPASRTNNALTTATFCVQASGSTLVSYRWCSNDVPLADGGNISGAATPVLTLSNVLRADAAGYSVIVSNNSGSVTSVLATLSVIDPAILSQPTNQSALAGQTVVVGIVGGGTAPVSYQWYKNGLPLADGSNTVGSITPALTLTNVLRADAADYFVVVSNSFGALTSSVATLTVTDPAILFQPLAQWVAPGQTAVLSVTAGGTPLLSYQWRKNSANLLEATNSALTFSNAQVTHSGTYAVVVTNRFGKATSAKATLTVSLTTDGFDPEPDGLVQVVAVQSDGRILVGGSFNEVGGQSSYSLARLHPDATADSSFNGSSLGLNVCALVVQPDGKMLVAGGFTQVGGDYSRKYFARLGPDGDPDPDFAPGAASYVYCLGLQSDGKILAGGSFTNLAGVACQRIARLSADGTPDTNFMVTASADATIYSLAIQPDGKILLGGSFTELNGQTRYRLGRLNSDGTLDTNFTASADADVWFVAVQADAKVLVAGVFTNLAGQPRKFLGRLNANGTLDAAFDSGADRSVYVLALQADGKILAGGAFSMLGGQAATNLARLNPDGSRDTEFNAGADRPLLALAVQPDGRVLAGGLFTRLGDQARNCVGRLLNPTPATQSLAFDGSTITWLRGGSSPEVWRTTFESSTDGIAWTDLGAGTRIADGWQLTGVSPPTNATIRARGFVGGGGIAEWFVETNLATVTLPAPVPLIHTGDGSLGFADGRFGFTLSGPPGLVAIIEASSNLVAWAPIQTHPVINGQVYFTDPQSAAFPKRFYRARFAYGASAQLSLQCPQGGTQSFASNHFGFYLSGMRGEDVVVETSTNLLYWTPILTNTLLTGYYYFDDPQSATAPSRFYRVRKTP